MAKNTNPTAAELIANINAGENILMEGKHGVGKTFTAREAAEKGGFNMRIFDAGLMDPYIELVGIPDVSVDEDGKKTLRQVRKNDLDDVEVLFFDEFNRAGQDTLNAIFGLVQFGEINGVKLPNLKCVIAAQNPAGDDSYAGNVELDAALRDRFDVTYEVKPFVSKSYLTKSLGDKGLSEALVDWHDSLPDGVYIAPRRVEKIGLNYQTHKSRRMLEAAIPVEYRGNGVSIADLWNRLNRSNKKAFPSAAPIDSIISSRGGVLGNIDLITKSFEDLNKQQCEVLAESISKIGVKRYSELWEIIEALNVVHSPVRINKSKMYRLQREVRFDKNAGAIIDSIKIL